MFCFAGVFAGGGVVAAVAVAVAAVVFVGLLLLLLLLLFSSSSAVVVVAAAAGANATTTNWWWCRKNLVLFFVAHRCTIFWHILDIHIHVYFFCVPEPFRRLFRPNCLVGGSDGPGPRLGRPGPADRVGRPGRPLQLLWRDLHRQRRGGGGGGGGRLRGVQPGKRLLGRRRIRGKREAGNQN